LRAGALALVRQPAPDAVDLLSRVDEKEEEREGAGRRRRDVERQRVHLREQLAERRRTVRLSAAVSRQGPQLFDGFEHGRAFEASNDASKGAGEPAHVIVQGLVFRASFVTSHPSGLSRGRRKSKCRRRLEPAPAHGRGRRRRLGSRRGALAGFLAAQ
jgi:hypothetical protein